jgi:predicted  nucleic acid-binding Zn-ribbon protein
MRTRVLKARADAPALEAALVAIEEELRPLRDEMDELRQRIGRVESRKADAVQKYNECVEAMKVLR